MENKKAYKLFRVDKNKKGKLFPLFVNYNKEIPINKWIEAEEGERDVNNPKKVKSKLGSLAFRPGWHLSEIPLAIHIGVKGESGNIEFQHKEYVWCECEYKDDINYQYEANLRGTKNEKIIPKNAFLDKIPKDGFYKYKTSPNQLGEWIIVGNIKVLRVLSDKEVDDIVRKNGYNPMPRKDGEINLKEYGF